MYTLVIIYIYIFKKVYHWGQIISIAYGIATCRSRVRVVYIFAHVHIYIFGLQAGEATATGKIHTMMMRAAGSGPQLN